MTSISYATKEFQLAPQYHGIVHYVYACLKEISKEGHSGGSMGVYSGMLLYWINHYKHDWNEVYPTPVKESMHYPLWKIVHDLDDALAIQVLKVTSKLMTFTPLTSLTGEDNEWMVVYEDQEVPRETVYQNRRMGTIFKYGKENSAYWLDGVIHYVPNSTYSDFTGFTGSYSKVPVTFPFDPETKPKNRYFMDLDYQKEIIESDAREWLKRAHTQFRLGFDPISLDIVPEALFVKEDKVQYLLNLLPAFVELESVLDSDYLDYFYSELLYTFRNKVGVSAEIVIDRAGFDYEYQSAIFKSTFKFVKKEGFRSHLTFLDTNLNSFEARNLYRLTSVPFAHVDQVPVKHPSNKYQFWCDSGLIWLNPIKERSDSDPTILYMDLKRKHVVHERPNQYLFKMCKELNLEYKGER